MNLILGDCLEKMRELPDNSVDSIITDPPYGLSKIDEESIRECLKHWLLNEEYKHGSSGFMGKEWDSFVPSPAYFKEMYRVSKPGATALVFAGTRTQDLMMLSMRLAGWECYDVIMYINGQGFPKALDVSKAIDKMKGEVGEVVGNRPIAYADSDCWGTPSKNAVNGIELKSIAHGVLVANNNGGVRPIITPSSEEAKLWEGWKTCLKPAYEPIIVARKKCEGSFAENALKWGVAGLNIDACRIAINKDVDDKRLGGKGAWKTDKTAKNVYEGGYAGDNIASSELGRFPANLILECMCDENGSTHTNPDCPCYKLDEQSGQTGAVAPVKSGQKSFGGIIYGKYQSGGDDGKSFYDAGKLGGASRFFYCAKASKSERNEGCDELESKSGARVNAPRNCEEDKTVLTKNIHPTVKPLKLMEYLCRLTKTPTGGIVLDPFMGSGTTGVACGNTGRDFIGIEMNGEYFNIAEKRIKAFEKEEEDAKLETLEKTDENQLKFEFEKTTGDENECK